MKSSLTMTAEKERMVKAARDAPDALGAHRRMLDLVALPANNAVLDAMRAFEENSAFLRRIMADLERSREMARLVAGPIDDLRFAGVVEQASRVSHELKLMMDNMAVYNARFRLPELSETVRLLTDLPSGISEILKRYEIEQSSFRCAIENMRRPWLDMQAEIRSIGGMAALQGIGHALLKMSPLGRELNTALRIDLGDWRDPITWRPEILTDLGARSARYVELGFNPALTDFPAPTFKEGLDVAGLDHERPELVTFYGEPIAASDDEEEEEGLNRTNKVHDWLLRLETQVRRFIDEKMTKAFGTDWPKQRLPAKLYDQWKEKQRKARQSGGREWALIAYADFTDYMLVIGKRDNWRVFAPFFGRLEDVRESFQRLHPIRLDTMHARPITQDDELLLYVEVRRLVRVMTHKRN